MTERVYENECELSALRRDFVIEENVELLNFVGLSRANQLEILRWRNHPITRQWMFHQHEINLEEHFRFLVNLEVQSHRFYWMLQIGEKQIGVINLCHYSQKNSEWGFYLNPEWQGTTYGITLIFHALNFFFFRLNIQNLYGFVLKENTNALFLHDLFYIQYRALEVDYGDVRTIACEYRTISKQDWQKQTANLKTIKERLIRSEDLFHRLKATTISRQIVS